MTDEEACRRADADAALVRRLLDERDEATARAKRAEARLAQARATLERAQGIIRDGVALGFPDASPEISALITAALRALAGNTGTGGERDG